VERVFARFYAVYQILSGIFGLVECVIKVELGRYNEWVGEALKAALNL
jgi:hypothetical protein